MYIGVQDHDPIREAMAIVEWDWVYVILFFFFFFLHFFFWAQSISKGSRDITEGL